MRLSKYLIVGVFEGIVCIRFGFISQAGTTKLSESTSSSRKKNCFIVTDFALKYYEKLSTIALRKEKESKATKY